jgi:hypothetical protein
MDEFGNIIQCKIHGIMHDLAISVAGSLITTLYCKERNLNEKTCHVSVGYDIDILSILTSLCRASRIQTFLYLGGQGFGAEIDCDAIFFLV